jgi:hypothetical protein
MHRRSQSLFFLLLLGLFAGAPSLLYGQTLEWDPNPEPDIDRYRVYRGTATGNYTDQVDVSNATACSATVCSYQPQGVDWSIFQYFAVTAINTGELESLKSDEVEWTPPSVTTFTSVSVDSGDHLAVGTPVTFTGVATNNLGLPLEYIFYLSTPTGWRMGRAYDVSNTWTWIPTDAEIGSPYYIQIWARPVGSTAWYEAWLGLATAFEVVPAPLYLSANVEFPTPADSLVTWTASATTAAATALEYQFQVMDVSTGNWTVFRDYAPNDQAQWTPGLAGSYVVRVWARDVGSSAPFESAATTDPLTVQPTALSVPTLDVDTTFPAEAGKPITWTARPRGGTAGPLQYIYWLYSPTTGWHIAQPYGPSQSFTWTPARGEEETYTLQVWARSEGTTGWYEAWRTSPGFFTINPADLHLTTSTLFPAPPGNQIQWTAEVLDPTAEYEFRVYSAATGQWAIAQTYGPTNTFTWVPPTTGIYAIQARARQEGSSAPYDWFADTNLLEISVGAAHLTSLVSDWLLPVSAGTTITWTAAATGGTGSLEYQFWRDDGTGWTLVQDYSAASTYSWTTTALDAGPHNLQVMARSAGSSEAFDSYMMTGTFSILP